MIPRPLSPASSITPPPVKSIDDLTTALSSFSRAHTPDPQLSCCCKRDDCDATRAWATLRSKLESRLVLSAEVGQALLQRHEAYVRRQDATLSRQASSVFSFAEEDESAALQQQVDYLTKKLDTVTEENNLMESRFNDLMIKHEMSDASARTVMRELQESRATIGRLSAQNARATGSELRLAQVTQERDDIRQERDSEAHRARHAESKAAAFVEKCTKLQNEVYRLKEEVFNFRASRAEFSKNVLQEARTRLESLQHSLGRDRTREDPETTLVLESLVADNETLKRDVAELQNLLVESREDIRMLNEELEEHRAAASTSVDADVTKVGTPLSISPIRGRIPSNHSSNNNTSPSSALWGLPHTSNAFSPPPRAAAAHARGHQRSPSGNARLLGDEQIVEWRNSPEDKTLLSSFRPRSPGDSFLLHPHAAKYSPTRHSGDSDHEPASTSHLKSLLLLTRSRGVQTEAMYSYPSPRSSTLGVDGDSGPSTPAPEGRSDTSSISQDGCRTVASLLERVTALLARLIQADVKTLTNRLKRQHLVSGDVGHLSRTTIAGILNDVAGLRAQVSIARDDALAVTRGDVKVLLKFCKDAFTELGTLREQLNDVVLDPSVAHRLRREAMEPELGKGDPRPPSAMGGWIAPIQKLFTNPMAAATGAELPSAAPSSGGKLAAPGATATAAAGAELVRGRTPARVVPKLAPAIAATSTTVNVEFASSGVRKTDTVHAPPPPPPARAVSGPTALRRPVPVAHATSARQLMGIFAGAPQSLAPDHRWVMLPPKGEGKDRVRQLKGAASSAMLNNSPLRTGAGGTLGRAAARSAAAANRLSRNVDAVIDQSDGALPAPDFRETLLERTLRPRGLSDSSIHTSFMKGEPEPEAEGGHSPERSDSSQSTDVGVPIIRGARQEATPSLSPATPASSPPARPAAPDNDKRARSPVTRLGRNLASWATVAAGGLTDLNGAHPSDLIVGSPREDSLMHAWTRRGIERRPGDF